MTYGATAGVDIGGTKIRAAVVTADGEVVASATAPTPRGGAAMLDVAAGLVDRAVAAAGRGMGHGAGSGVGSGAGSGAGRAGVTAVGVGAAGVVDPVTGEVLAASDSFTGWVGTDLRAGLASRTGLPVTAANDVDAFLVGEATWGAVRGVRSAAGIALGTGVGGALWLDGALYRGAGAAGEIGHMPGFGDAVCTCGQRGHLETLASGRSVERRYAEAVGAEAGVGGVSAGVVPGSASALGAAEIEALARAGDPAAVRVFADAGHAVGSAVLVVAALLDVGHVVVGGGLARAWDLLEPALLARLREAPPVSGHPVEVRHAALGGDATVVGAAALARRA
ncbi:ROK family protein [Promicromonospora thailandica]|uniref:Glucokinase n=1 Tax=Promicromonospora thailandica TaxID=765201 RepID=A0A9X2JT69_9MICO|nr:ROK family protein [Promicromonospora thailandica]MCP2263205.1 glucokinase [Promicromonospora thailandica]